jgi:hypothetical protein
MLALACAGMVFLAWRLNQRKPAVIFLAQQNYRGLILKAALAKAELT